MVSSNRHAIIALQNLKRNDTVKCTRGSLADSGIAMQCVADSAQGLAVFSPQDRLSFANDSFLRIYALDDFGPYSWDSMVRNCYVRKQGLLIEADDVDAWIDAERSQRRRRAVRTYTSSLVDGRCMWVSETMRPDGWLCVAMTDITALKREEAALRRAYDSALLAANTDALTGLLNRRSILSRIDDALSEMQKTGHPFCISMLDIDHFKEINDTYGHLAGDRVIQHLAERAQHHLRPADALGRIGGEEFLLVFPGTELAGATQAVERLRGRLKRERPIPGNPTLAYTFSAGVTQARATDTREILLQRVDRALYAAKRAGRNCHIARA